MMAVPEETLREAAAANEPPGRLASPEFFFLLQRIDRLDEKLSREIREETTRLEAKLDAAKFWAIGLLVTTIVGFAGVIFALLRR